ncbi:subtilisin-like serine protease [Ceratobasidium sp. 428]|nr:subtilisin-like serine protease [Ceratobasidium sp. 428]
MCFPTIFVTLLLASPIFGAPTLVPITKRAGPVKPKSWIVTFKDTASKNNFINTGPGFTQPDSSVTYNWKLIPAAAMIVNPLDMKLLQMAAGMESIEPDMITSINYQVGLDGFEAANHHDPTYSSTRMEKRSGNGEGVTVYGIDTGIYTDHKCFGGRASWGAVFGGYEQKDGNGHGTHTAGTAVGSGLGIKPAVAPMANIVAIKVLSDSGSGPTSDVISGVEWAVNDALNRSKPSIVTMSLGLTGTAKALEDVVRSGIDHGVHFTIAAGNSGLPASTSSPANVKEANTIGAIDEENRRAYFSNFGQLIDVWYLGVKVKSAWITNDTSTMELDGTSMATPGAAAYIAEFLSKPGNGKLSPAAVTQKMKDGAVHDVKDVAGLPLVGSTDGRVVSF